jgi:hypothetical protein
MGTLKEDFTKIYQKEKWGKARAAELEVLRCTARNISSICRVCYSLGCMCLIWVAATGSSTADLTGLS